MLWATHLWDEAADADRVVVMHQGQVLRDATPGTIPRELGVKRLEDARLVLTSGGASQARALAAAA